MRKKAAKSPKTPPLHLEWRSPAELEDNPANWRTHPDSQLTALSDVIGEVGWVGACLYNERTGRLVDGHVRKQIGIDRGDKKIPVLVGNWSEEDELKILATLDPVSAMAARDAEKLNALLGEIEFENDSLTALTNEIAGVVDDTQIVEEKSEKLKTLIESRKKSNQRFKDKDEVNFWVNLVFDSYEQKMEFLNAVSEIPTLYGMFVNGEDFAKRFGIRVTPSDRKPFTLPLNKKLTAMVMKKENE